MLLCHLGELRLFLGIQSLVRHHLSFYLDQWLPMALLVEVVGLLPLWVLSKVELTLQTFKSLLEGFRMRCLSIQLVVSKLFVVLLSLILLALFDLERIDLPKVVPFHLHRFLDHHPLLPSLHVCIRFLLNPIVLPLYFLRTVAFLGKCHWKVRLVFSTAWWLHRCSSLHNYCSLLTRLSIRLWCSSHKRLLCRRGS